MIKIQKYHNARWISPFMLCFIFAFLFLFQVKGKDSSGKSKPPNFIKAENFLFETEYDSAIRYYKYCIEELDISNNSALHLNCLLRLVECNLIKAEFEECYLYIHEIESFISNKEFSDSTFLASYYFIRSKIYYSIDDYIQSTAFIEKALNAMDGNASSDSLKVLLYKAKGNNYYVTNMFDSALFQYTKALELEKSRSSDSTLAMATLWGNIGLVYSRKGLHSKADSLYQKSLRLKEKLLDPYDPKLASAYNNYGRTKVIIGEYDEAIHLFNQAEIIYLEKFGADSYNNALLYFNKGSAYINKKDFEKALSYHMKSIEIYQKYLDVTNPIFGKIYSNLGLIYRNLGENKIAIDYYKKSIDLVNDPVSLPIIYRNLAHCYYSLNDVDSAKAYFFKAKDVSLELLGLKHFQTATSYKALGDFYIQQKDYLNSEKYLFKALEIFLEPPVNNKNDLASTYLSIGLFYQTQEDIIEALKNYQLVLITSSDEFFSPDFRYNPELDKIDIDYNIVLTLKEKSRTLLKLYNKISKNENDLVASFESAKLGIALFEKIRSSLMTEDDKLFLTNDIFNLYELSVIAATKLYEVTGDVNYFEEAFTLAEKSKASILLSSIKELEASNFSAIPDSLRQLEKNLKNDIAITEHLIYEENTRQTPEQDKIKVWNNDLFALQRKYERLISKLENEYSDYYDLKYNFNVLSAADIKKKINDDILIEYFHADSILFAFYISSDTMGYSKTFINDTYNQNVLEFIEITHSPPSIDNSSIGFENFTRISNELYIDLIQPLEMLIKKKNVLFIPDALLGYVPFEALITGLPWTGKTDYRNLPYLINQCRVRYSYSASLLFKDKHKKRTRGKLLAFAPSYESRLLNQDTQHIASASHNLLRPLDFNVEEVKGIESILGGDIHLGINADVGAFRQNAENYTILHLAMHTLIDDEEPLASKLAFTSNTENQEDGYLNAYEIYNMNLNAQMVVLSACQTGAGNLSRGEGIMSMARGFFYAGVPGIVMTLWEIEDESSLKIMVDFYSRIKDKKSKDEALQLAKQHYFQSSSQLYAHPYYWAAYVQIGNNSAISFHSVYSQRIFLVSAMIIFIMVVVLITRKRSSKKVT